MSMTQIYSSLEQLLRQQITATRELNQILDEESTALAERDHEHYQKILAIKQLKTSEMESLANQQTTLLANIGLPQTANSLDKIIDSSNEPTKKLLTELRRELETSLQTCQKQNMVNGQIIAVSQQSAKTALSILRGQLNADELTYGAGGQTVVDHSANPITKA